MVGINQLIGWSKDRETLSRSASGGIAYEISKSFIENGGVVSCIAENEDQIPHRILAKSVDDLKNTYGSKYVIPINSTKVNRELLDYLNRDDTPVLFIGNPCQIQNVKNVYWINDNLYTITFQCHGYPKLERTLRRNGENKQQGWSKSWHHLPKKYIKSSKRYMMPRCYKCQVDRYNADITLSDAWGCQKHQINERGTSRIKINTENGNFLFQNNNKNIYFEIENTYQHKPERIALLDVHDYHNFGNNLLCINFMKRYRREVYDDAQFILLTPPVNELAQVIEAQTNFKENKDFFVRHTNILDGFSFNLVKQRIQTDAFADCKDIIVLGGDCFATKKWLWRWTGWLLLFYKLQREGKNVLFVSNTIGDFPFYAKPMFKKILNKCKAISVRDYWSVDQIINLGVKNDNLFVECDLGIMPFNEETYKKEPYIVFSPSALWKNYATSVDNYQLQCKKIIMFLRKNIKPHIDIRIMAYGSSNAERQMASTIAELTNCSHYIVNNAKEAESMLGRSKFNVCFRMHSAIQSIALNTPFVVFSYGHKYNAVIGEYFGFYDNILCSMDYFKFTAKFTKLCKTHEDLL